MTGPAHPGTRMLSRRGFLVTVGGTSIGIAFGGLPRGAFAAAPAEAGRGGYAPNAWVTIGEDGVVSIISPASEVGQGIMTTLPLLIAEDMDADWSKVRVVQAPADAGTYGNPGFYGIQLTGGSESTRGYYSILRLVGAQTRKIILASAADLLGVPVDELATGPNTVVHPASGRTLGYGDIARTGRLPDPVPQATPADLKPAARWRLIGSTTVPRVDVPAKVDGRAVFGIDVRPPNLLHGAVLRPPVQGETPAAIDDRAARAVPGIVRVVPLPYGVGIIGETVEATANAKALLHVTWTTSSRVRSYTSDALLEEYRAVGRDLARAGGVVHNDGDAPAAIATAAHVITADYLCDHVHHATMEPMTATARVSGDRVEIWAPTQGPTFTQRFAANAAGTSPEKVTVNTTLIGGGFGRKAEEDFIVDAVLLAKAADGRPVKLLWSREDDVRHGKYRPLAAQHVQVGLDADGRIVGWRHRVVADSVFARTMPGHFQAEGGLDSVVTEGLAFNYRTPARLVEYLRQDRGLDVGFWRAVGVGYTRFAVDGVVDEIAAATGTDPVALRLDLLRDEPRARAVIKAVAGMAEWDRPRDGRALGIAYSDAFDAHCAQVAEVSVDRSSGTIRVHTVWCAIDPGLAIQPFNIEAQMEGNIVHGISHALYEQINVDNGEVRESNFDTYRVMRLSETPDIHVRVMPTPANHPAGIGQVGLPPIGPAIANAVARLTGGARLRHYPFLPERVRAALGA